MHAFFQQSLALERGRLRGQPDRPSTSTLIAFLVGPAWPHVVTPSGRVAVEDKRRSCRVVERTQPVEMSALHMGANVCFWRRAGAIRT